METKLTDEEIIFTVEMQNKFSVVFLPVPIFVYGISDIQKQNFDRVMGVVKDLRSDEAFVQTTGMRSDRLGYVLVSAADFALWKRGLMMRIQWLFQLLAFILLFKVLLSWFM